MGLRKNKSGGIEGLPMELMIIVVVATLGTGLVVGWMNDVDAPDTIGDVSCSVNQIVMNSDKMTTNFTITVRDSDGDAIKNAVVTLSGCGVSKGTGNATVYATTDGNGIATFSSLSVTKTTNGVGYINVSVSAGEYGEYNNFKIPVVR